MDTRRLRVFLSLGRAHSRHSTHVQGMNVINKHLLGTGLEGLCGGGRTEGGGERFPYQMGAHYSKTHI